MGLLVGTCFLVVMLAICEGAQLIANFSEGTPVWGVVSIDDLVYVIHDDNSCIEIYDTSYNYLMCLNVTDMNHPYDMTMSEKTHTAFMVDRERDSLVFQVLVKEPYNLNRWPFNVDGTATVVGLSWIPGEDSILVTEDQTNSLKELANGGQVLKTVTLQSIERPRQAVKLSEDRYVVCYGYYLTDKHQVCVVDANGEVVGKRCFGDTPGVSLKQLHVPARLFVREDGSILVADLKNHRILKLDSSLTGPAEVVVSSEDGLSGPYRIHVDEARKLLYVGDITMDETGRGVAGRVLVYDLSSPKGEL